jgi:hypothetical protein
MNNFKEDSMNNKSNFVGNHGDRDFFQIPKLPKGAKLIGKFKKFVDQEGETTGHQHVLLSAKEFEVYQIQDRWIYLLNAPAEISHEEHPTRQFEPGIYETNQENEEDPWLDIIVRVVD